MKFIPEGTWAEVITKLAQSNTTTQVKIPAHRPAIAIKVRRQLLEKAGHLRRRNQVYGYGRVLGN